MFLFYYVWYLLYDFVHYFRTPIEKLYIKYNNPFVINSRMFSDLSYFEKLFLVMFHKRYHFVYSLAHLKNPQEIDLHRKNNYPYVNFFYLYRNRKIHTILAFNLNFLIQQFNFFLKRGFFKKIWLKKFFFKKKIISKDLVLFCILQKIWFKNHFDLNENIIFEKSSFNNIIEFNFLYSLLLIGTPSRKRLLRFNFYFYNDWYVYTFKFKNKKTFKKKFLTSLTIKQQALNKTFREARLLKIGKTYKKYNFKYQKYLKLFKYKTIWWFRFNFNKLRNFRVLVNWNWYKTIKKKFVIRFSESSITKHINIRKISNFSIFYLRKNRIFNKSRYSRNRQLYRTGVYWCLWLNILIVYGLYFLFYRFSFNFGYIWWGVLVLLYSTIFSRVVKYNFYNVFYVYKEFKAFLIWVGYIFMNLYDYFWKIFLIFSEFISLQFFLFKNLYSSFFHKKILAYFYKIHLRRDSVKMIEFWHGLKEKDTSFLRYKTIIHWIKLCIKVLIYY